MGSGPEISKQAEEVEKSIKIEPDLSFKQTPKFNLI